MRRLQLIPRSQFHLLSSWLERSSLLPGLSRSPAHEPVVLTLAQERAKTGTAPGRLSHVLGRNGDLSFTIVTLWASQSIHACAPPEQDPSKHEPKMRDIAWRIRSSQTKQMLSICRAHHANKSLWQPPRYPLTWTDLHPFPNLIATVARHNLLPALSGRPGRLSLAQAGAGQDPTHISRTFAACTSTGLGLAREMCTTVVWDTDRLRPICGTPSPSSHRIVCCHLSPCPASHRVVVARNATLRFAAQLCLATCYQYPGLPPAPGCQWSGWPVIVVGFPCTGVHFTRGTVRPPV